MNRWQSSHVALVGIVLLALPAGLVAAEGPPRLQYGFENGREYVYDVKIVADLPDQVVTYQGSLTYAVLSTAGDQFTLKCSGALQSRTAPKPGPQGIRRFGPPGFGPPGFGGPRPPLGPFREPSRPEGTTFNRQGDVVIAGRLRDLPFLLGKQDLLVIEPLSKEAKAAWTKELDLGVVEESGSPFRFGPFASSETNRGAKERIDFKLIAAQGDAAKIAKTYSLKTVPGADGVTYIDMSGSGELAFDLKAGVFQSQSMKYAIRVNERGVTVTIPLAVDYRLLTQDEIAQRKKQAAEAAAAAAEAAKPKPLAPGEREQLIQDLRSRDDARIKAAAQRLSKAVVDDRRAEVCQALTKALGERNEWIQAEILGALKVWCTPDAEPAILAASRSKTFFVRDAAIGMLGNFKTADSAKAAAEAMLVNRHAATEALKAIGPLAESVTIPLLDDRDFWVRSSACEVLSAIGGKKSLGTLKEQVGKRDGLDRHAIDRAIEALEKRVAQGGDEPAGTDRPAAAGQPEVRTWRDATGTYTIEASLARFENGEVTLKKAGGRTITLSLDKLSKEDQEYLKKQGKPKPPNPFE